jgi:hypothetical protein
MHQLTVVNFALSKIWSTESLGFVKNGAKSGGGRCIIKTPSLKCQAVHYLILGLLK